MTLRLFILEPLEVCVFMYIYIYIYTHPYLFTYMYKYILNLVTVFTHFLTPGGMGAKHLLGANKRLAVGSVYIHTYSYVYICMYTYIHIYVYVYIYICIYIYIYTHTHTNKSVAVSGIYPAQFVFRMPRVSNPSTTNQHPRSAIGSTNQKCTSVSS